MLAFRSFEDAGFSGKLRAVPEDEEGIDLGFLRREIHKSEEKAKAEGNTKPTFKPARPYAKIYRHVIYCVPTFANPSSRTMSLSHRKELVRCAREYDALVICDDVYDFLQWPADIKTERSSLDKAVMPRVVDIDRVLDGGAERADSDGFGNVVSNASFSKIGAPGMRTGWVEGTEKFAYGVAQTGGTWSGGAPSQMSSTYISDLLESGALQSHVLRTLQPAYASRYRTLVSAIDRYLVPLGITLPQPDRAIVGGYFVWLHLPDGLSGAALARRAKEEENVIVPEGEMFEVPGDEEAARFGDNVRLCFSWEDEDKLVEGVRRLSGVVRRMQRDGERGGSQPQTGAAREGKHDLGAFR
ncbi:Valine--pyruvate aminotransferase [Cryomyces antarcticus]|uniref:Valine--pyruvate aminotransferase n=1 Tax=Cryomyces antarcticus TaxID=329879 RepID=A0ABR0LWS2_9PEZI|nr:Valine--pyruvate aminotransferase [Cryomyces antarcticus]